MCKIEEDYYENLDDQNNLSSYEYFKILEPVIPGPKKNIGYKFASTKDDFYRTKLFGLIQPKNNQTLSFSFQADQCGLYFLSFTTKAGETESGIMEKIGMEQSFKDELDYETGVYWRESTILALE